MLSEEVVIYHRHVYVTVGLSPDRIGNPFCELGAFQVNSDRSLSRVGDDVIESIVHHCFKNKQMAHSKWLFQ